MISGTKVPPSFDTGWWSRLRNVPSKSFGAAMNPIPSKQARADAVYARYSSHKQDDGTSIDVQLETCHRAAGGPCVDYVDRARTGRSIGGRVQLLKLMDDAEAGRI